jgi:para-nitrobenzyl esterase
MVGRGRFVVLVAVAANVLAVFAAQPAMAASGSSAGHLVVPTDQGVVRGVRADGVDSFLGIRYAAPPVGPRRWRPRSPLPPGMG